MKKGDDTVKWVTARYATGTLNLTHRQMCELDSMTVYAPNDICWTVYGVPEIIMIRSNKAKDEEGKLFNIFKVVEKALDAIAHDVKQVHFEAGHLEVKAKVSVSGKVYDATLTIDEEVPETPLDG